MSFRGPFSGCKLVGMDTSPLPGVAVVTRKKGRRQRFSRVASAATTIEGFDHEHDISFGFTLGQFSLLDLVEAALDLAGPADVVISTWSVGFYDLDAAERF